MRKTKIIVTLLCFWLGLMPLAAQSVTITKDFAQVPMASVLAMYKNEFGSYEKPDMTDTFPYAVIRMHLEGNAHTVTAAKEQLTLYLGQQFGVESRVTTYSNQILFLVRARRPYIYIDCGDGCEPKLLSGGQQLRSNCVYDCAVCYIPAGETPSNIDTELLSNLETRLDSLQLVQEQKIESLQQAQLAAQEKPLIVRHSKYDQNLYGIEEYSYGRTQMDKKALQLFLQENSPAAYKKYTQSKKMITAGWWMFGGGMSIFCSGMLIMGFTNSYTSTHNIYVAGAVLTGIGPVFVASAIVILPIGYHRQNHAYELYNYEQKKKQPQLSLGVQASENGIGLALQF